MYFTHDPTNQFYYMGNEPATGNTFRKHIIEGNPRIVACDVETISLKERIAIGVSVATSPTCCFYFPLFPIESPLTPWHLLRDPDTVNIYHNGIFDLGVMSEFNIKQDIQDTNIMSRLLCHKFNGLEDLSWLHGMEIHNAGDMLKEAGVKAMLDLPEEVVARKCMQDSMATFKLYLIFYPQTNHKYYDVERATLPIMLKMTERGILIDHMVRQGIELQLEDDADLYMNLCEEIEMFNPGSPQQVSYVLAKRGAYEVFGRLPFTRNKYGKRTSNLSTNVKTLEKMTDPLAQLILEYRNRAKLLSTYIKPWANDERAYTMYHLDAITGRPSSTGGGVPPYRNMQNIPGKFTQQGILNTFNCRGILLPDSGMWTDVDLEQVEPRALAYLSGDREMSYIFEQPKYNHDGSKNEDADIHLQVAIFMNVHRRIGKTVNLSMTYGASDQTLADTAKVHIHRAAEFRLMWGRKFPQAWDYIISKQEEAFHTHRAVSAFGRQMRLPDEDEDSTESIKSKAIDYPCQSTAADILKRGLIALQDMDIALQIHDELLVDGLELPEKFSVLENIAPFRTPVEVKYLERWE